MTDRDDFNLGGIRGINRGPEIKNTVVLYGAAPFDNGPGTPYRPVDFTPVVPVPMPTTIPNTNISLQPYQGTEPGEPDTAEKAVERIKARIAWLERELRMHDAWRQELAVLQRMVAAAESPTSSKPSEGT